MIVGLLILVGVLLLAGSLGWAWDLRQKCLSGVKDRAKADEFWNHRLEQLDTTARKQLAELNALESQVAKHQASLAALEQEAGRLVAENRNLAADCAFWRGKAEQWEGKFEAANADAIKARETIADWVSQRTFGTKIFSHAPSLPERAKMPQPVLKHRIQGREAVHMAEAQFDRDYAAYLAGATNGAAPVAGKE